MPWAAVQVYSVDTRNYTVKDKLREDIYYPLQANHEVQSTLAAIRDCITEVIEPTRVARQDADEARARQRDASLREAAEAFRAERLGAAQQPATRSLLSQPATPPQVVEGKMGSAALYKNSCARFPDFQVVGVLHYTLSK